MLEIEGFETQAANEDGSRPDLRGFDAEGQTSTLIEVKFWAGLTQAQPSGYLAAVRPGGVLLFVAPEARLTTLWDELRRRLVVAGGALSSLDRTGNALAVAVGETVVAATSWRALLSVLEREAVVAADAETAADIRQLNALCEQMDTEAFLPLSSEELTSSLGRRVRQFETLASDLTNALIRHGVADVTGLRPTAGFGYCGRYLYLRGNAALLAFNANCWAELGQSPLWLEVYGDNWKRSTPSEPIKQALQSVGIDFWQRGKAVCVPLILPTQVEREGVIAAAEAQLLAIAAALPELPRVGAPPPDNEAIN